MVASRIAALLKVVAGFDAMMRGDGNVVSGWKNKVKSAVANVTRAGVFAERYRKMAEPGMPKDEDD